MGKYDWTKDASGNFVVNPLVGMSTMVFTATAIGLRLEHLMEADSLHAPSGSVQLILNPPQAIELAQVLLRAADQAMKTSFDKPT